VSTERFDLGGVDLDATLRVLAMLPGDPTLRLGPGTLARGTQTPDGPATLVATWRPGDGWVDVSTHGPGAPWLMRRAPGLLGLADDTFASFEPPAGEMRELLRRHRSLRIVRTGTLWHDLCWLVVQQRVQRQDAADQWRRLVLRYGTPAPHVPELFVPPAPEVVAASPGHELHGLGIERRRADTLRAAARSRLDLHGLADRDTGDAVTRPGTIPGIGPWTTSTLTAITWGDPDAVIVGDSGIPHLVSWVVAGERRATDERMMELLEPYRPHRYRVLQLAFASGRRPPRQRPYPRRTDISGF
jgi:3-methyladenine DNA glycosylase/8-oxoguanine DNA glycosylase